MFVQHMGKIKCVGLMMKFFYQLPAMDLDLASLADSPMTARCMRYVLIPGALYSKSSQGRSVMKGGGGVGGTNGGDRRHQKVSSGKP